MMTIVPATYAVTVSVTANQHPATTVTPGQPLTIVARVGRTVETGPNQTAFVPLTTGSVTATVGPEAALSEQGQLKQGHSVALQYDPASQTWTGTAATDDLSPGFYVVQVQAADTVTPPNTGTGNSAIFAVNQAPTPASPKTYTVQRGDTLWGIAARLLGSGARWPTLYQLNRARIGPNPNLIRPGLVLEVP
ncbi:MAG: LysM peptidoglycan-binding domain-containing protein [Actinomycetia bacterium]|nr:LysM peptidoglycan-binding domain-containing protein [Actinomycetes bacterium]